MKKRSRFGALFIIIALIATFFIVSSSNFFGKKYAVEVGQIANETLYAPFQVENEIATQRKKDEVEKRVENVYKINDHVERMGISQIELLFDYAETISSSNVTTQFNVSPLALLQVKSPIPLYEDEYKTLLVLSNEKRNLLENICIQVFQNVVRNGVKEDENKALEIKGLLEKTELNAIEQKLSYEIISSQVKPNIVIDNEATRVAKQTAREQVEPIYVLQGEKIVGQGSRVTEEEYQLLVKVGFIDTDEKQSYMQYLGLIIVLLVIILFLIRYFDEDEVLQNLSIRQSSLLFIVYMLSLIIIRVFLSSQVIFLPISIGTMLIAILIKKEIATIFHIVVLIISALTTKGDIIFILYILLTGLMAIQLVGTMKQRKHMIRCALMVGGIRVVIYLAIHLLVGMPFDTLVIIESGQAFIVGVIEVVLVVGSLPLWESVFGFITPIQLLELTNPNQPVLKRLLLEATGTYYHSLLVANLAEAAASEIGANTLLTRVGGYYHDIGKLTSSNYFKENQMRDNPHDYIDPKTSCDLILSHVSSGIEIADAYKLPICVKDMIEQHHGTGIIQYFYVKAKNIDEAVVEADFSYPGPKPQTREAALVMLADVVEATVRAMQHKIGTEVTVEELVRKMVKGKLEEGQLDECPLYISDIEKIIHSFTHMLKGMYHERIEYPEKEKERENK